MITMITIMITMMVTIMITIVITMITIMITMMGNDDDNDDGMMVTMMMLMMMMMIIMIDDDIVYLSACLPRNFTTDPVSKLGTLRNTCTLHSKTVLAFHFLPVQIFYLVLETLINIFFCTTLHIG